MSSCAKQTAPPEVPPGTRLVLYACLPMSLGEAADHSVVSAQRYVDDAGWEAVETYVDRAAPFESRVLCEGWHNTLAAVEQGRAAGIVTPLLVMLGHLEEDRSNLAARPGGCCVTGPTLTTLYAGQFR